MDKTERFKKVMEILQTHDMGSNSFRDYEFFNDFTEKDFDNEERIADVIQKIKEYELYDESDKKYPTYIYEIIRQNLGEDKYDISIDDIINNMDSDEVFKRVCIWNNIVNFDTTIKNWVKDIYGVTL